MLLDDFVSLLWAYGGNLAYGVSQHHIKATGNRESFVITASNFISTDARMATCIFNLVIDMAPRLSVSLFEHELGEAKYDVRRLGVLVSIVRSELERVGDQVKAHPWIELESKLMSALATPVKIERLLPHLPSIPGWKDPLFLAWGFDYPGIIREPGKYLRNAI